MDLLIKSVQIVDPGSPFSGERKDILIKGGRITGIDDNIHADGCEIFNAEGLKASPGWFDTRANFRDPGFEYKEDISSGARAAIAGGFTAVAISPATCPAVHSKSQVEYIKSKAAGLLTDLYPIGTISHSLEGRDLSEMYDMHLAGAVAFSDDKKPVSNAGLFLRALFYAKNFKGLVMSYPEEKELSSGGLMNEGLNSTLLGLKGIPYLAEDVMVRRDLALAEYADSPIHFSNISSPSSITLIREAKARGLKVTADINAYLLALDDSVMDRYDSNYKVKPPLRSAKDIDAFIKGLADGTLDIICSDHNPEDEESKNVEFEYATYGMIGLETAYAVINTSLRGVLTDEQIIEKIAINPRKLLSLPVPSLMKDSRANLTVFDPTREWIFGENDIRSKSRNTPFIGRQFTGKAVAVFNNDQFSMCKDG
jgi:dihydroorotase